MIDTFGIPVAFIIIAALTLWVVIGCKGYWWLKMITVSLSVFFSISLWVSLVSLQGWPTSQMMPNKFEVKWLDVKEPNKKTGEEGAIYVWAKDLEPNKKQSTEIGHQSAPKPVVKLHSKEKSNESRLYKLPYNRTMHKQSEMIKGIIGQGGRFYGTLTTTGKPGEAGMSRLGGGKAGGKGGKGGERGEGKSGKGYGRGGISLADGQEFVFHELPPPVFPSKEGPSEDVLR